MNEAIGAPGVAIRRVSIEAPWSWLNAGWRDMWTYPLISLGFGFVFFALAVAMFIGMTQAGLQSLILAMAGGFMILAPAFAVGLYDLSRRIEKNEPVTVTGVLLSGTQAQGQLAFLGAMLTFLYYIWLQIAFLLFMYFFRAAGSFPPFDLLMSTLLFKPHGLSLLIVGTIVGAILAAIAFAVSVISVPLVLVHRIDAISAVHVSVEAVVRNPKPMALWAGLIAATIAVGMLTSFVGLIFVFPWIGHASWHAFRDVVQLDER